MNRKPLYIFIGLALAAAGVTLCGFTQSSGTTSIAGGQGGSTFSDTAIPYDARVAEVHVYAGEMVDAVQLVYIYENGRTQPSVRHGGPGGRQNVFRLDSDEYIVGISGRYGKYIDSLQIHTNKRISPLYGGRGGDRDFRIDVPSGNYAVGFAGRSGEYMDAVGLVYIPFYTPASLRGVYGGGGGAAFSDTNIPQGARISEVRVYSGNFVDGIQAVYILPDGRTYEGQFHGNRGGRASVFRLDPDEYITGISGRYGDYIDSLTLRTNKRTSPAYGGRGGRRDFSVELPSGYMAIGFSGRAGKYLDAIGLNSAPLSPAFRSPQRQKNGRFRVPR